MMNLKRLLALSLVSLLPLSCDTDDFLEEDIKDALTADDLYVNNSGFVSGMNAIYSFMREIKGSIDSEVQGSNDYLWVMHSDTYFPRRPTQVDFSLLESPVLVIWDDAFEWLYQIIVSTNLIISRAEGSVDWEGLTEEENEANKNLILAEARVARAWAYRLLIYAFGPVPLNAQEITGDTWTNAWSRNSIEEIKELMREDLEFAENILPLRRVDGDDTRISGAVARHYLGELYLSLGEFENAVNTLEVLCESGEYQLIQNRFGRLANDPDGNHFIDIFRNPYSSSGNTETFFVFANGVELQGSQIIGVHDAYVNNFTDFLVMENEQEFFYTMWGGFARGRWFMTPWSAFNQEEYERYASLQNDALNPISDWIWENTDGRTDYLYENQDIRSQNESIRRYFAFDFNGNGTVTDTPPTTLDQGILNNDSDLLNVPVSEAGDTIYTYYTWDVSALGFPSASFGSTYPYSRKWEIDETHTFDFNIRENSYPDISYLRIAESYLLYAEALMMLGRTGEAAQWINLIRERAGASTITAAEVTLDFILDERARELNAEEERRITLLRTGKLLERTRQYNALSKFYIQDYHKLWPFPANAIIANKDNPLDQNVGYGGSTTVDFTPPGYPDEGINP
ncbi:MAG: RagB/SusD family nutrient uptake outer membrane protein [Bacteroidota bacterium]